MRKEIIDYATTVSKNTQLTEIAKVVKTEEELAQIGVDVIYLPHTDGVSTTLINETIKKKYEIKIDQRQ